MFEDHDWIKINDVLTCTPKQLKKKYKITDNFRKISRSYVIKKDMCNTKRLVAEICISISI